MAAGKTTAMDAPEVVERALVEGTFSVQKFVESFGVLVEAAGGVKLLRELILTLAVRGQLTERQSADDDVKNLVADIQRKRGRLGVGRSAHGADKGDGPVVDDPPFAIPTSWRWTRLEDLGVFMGGGTPSKSNLGFWKGPIPWVSPKDMKRPYIGDAEDHISQAAIEGSSTKLIPAKSILFVVRGMILAHSFPVAITTCEVTVNQDMKALVLACPAVADFMLRVCQDAKRRVLERIERSSHGTCRLDSEVVESLLVPLPPVAEQKRIVARVDQLMALIDQLEAKQNRKREVGARFTKASLEALTAAESPQDFTAAWTRIQSTWPTLLDSADKVAELKKAALDLAIRGRLTRQDPEDEPAARLLSRMGVERPVPKTPGPQGGKSPEVPFDLPESWAWAELAETWLVVTDGDHQPPPKTESGVAFLTIGNVSGGKIDFTDTRFVSRSYFDSLDRNRVPARGDLLYTVVGSFGIPVLVDTKVEFCIQRHIAILKPLKETNVAFMYYMMKSGFVYRQAAAAVTGIAQPTLGLGVLRRLLIPIPPLAEQERIVAKVEHLMKLCDALEAALRRSEDRAAKLACAVVQEMVV